MKKENWDYFGFGLLRHIIGLENSRHFFDQSDLKLKSIATRLLAFSHALGGACVFALSSYWFLVIYFPLFSLAVVMASVLVSRHSSETCLTNIP